MSLYAKTLISKLHKVLRSKINYSTSLINQCEHLKDRSVIQIAGKDSIIFLQGLVTNDVRDLSKTETPNNIDCIYTLLLNVQGRVLYDAFMYKDPIPDSPNIFIDCDTSISQDLMNHLIKFRVRRKIDIKMVDKQVWWFANSNQSISNGNIIVKDPRIEDLGFRGIFDSNTDQKEVLSDSKTANLYRETIYKRGIGEGITDHPPANCFPLECNGDYLNGVNFHKGCYIGQELTSRVHHTGVVRKRIMPVQFEKEITEVGDVSVMNENGKVVGKLRGVYGKFGIALLRIAETSAAKELKIMDNIVSTFKPNWWISDSKKEE